ncbi:MAG: VCBS repeat-containing protein, partial [Bacteroidales bacterium]|nr:VCBS repeat-containing protein [Bacteroidales bacterium]
MKAAVLSISLLICIFSSAINLFSQHPETGRKPLITYIESSTGLASPEWEGGRTELEFADMNGDGNIDIITIGDHGNPGIQSGEQGIMVYFGDGQGNWSCQMGGDLGYGGIAAGDVNNDGLMDIGYGMHHDYSSTDLGDQLMEVALGDGTGTNWTPWDDGLATNGEDWGMFSTDFADVENDGDLDLGSISFGCCAGIHVYLNNMDGTWTQSFGFLDGNSDMIFQFGDMNNDGNMDFITGGMHAYPPYDRMGRITL